MPAPRPQPLRLTTVFVLLALAPLPALAQDGGTGPNANAFAGAGAAAFKSVTDKAKRGPGTALDRDCLVCHAGVGEEDAPKLDMKAYATSVHADEGCVGCHADVTDEGKKHEEKDDDLAPVACGRCHEDQDAKWKHSVHAAAPPEGKKQATCATCHGTHDIVDVKNPASSVHPLNQLATCGQCHGTDRVSAGHKLEVPEKYREAIKTMSADEVDALMKKGELVSAACSDCHGAHDVEVRSDPGSRLYPGQVVKTCRQCHSKQADEYLRSAHGEASQKPGFKWAVTKEGLVQVTEGEALNGEDPKPTQPPVCSTCHHIHSGGTPKSVKFRLDVVKECGTCHARLMETYSDSYHGKATLLGNSSVAKCSDCHTAHSNLPASDPRSTVSPQRRLETCRKCHKNAPENYVGFWPHADAHDGEKYPALHVIFLAMTTLLVSVFVFFGIHTLLWIIRDIIEAWRERGKPKHKHTMSGPFVSRFSVGERLTHLFVIISFLGLAATGAPLKFAYTGWAKGAATMLGGVPIAGTLHRIFAVMTFGYFTAHVISLVRRLARHFRARTLKSALVGPESLVPQLSDLKDILRNFRYFFGGPKPTFDRWTYWEKFDYWAVFWGVAIIGGSGLLLWFPGFFLKFLPGWTVNIALVIHSDEALMAIGFIFGVHFFNGHLRRAKFPMDPVMFIGSVPEAEYKEERGREWERLVDSGRVDARQGKAPTPGFFRLARIFGIAAWITGLIILGFIVFGAFFSH